MTAPRKPSEGPPKGFRPHMSKDVKLRAALRLAGINPDEPLEWDHDPPLQQRVWDPFWEDTIPKANDDRHIVPCQKLAHRLKTAKRDIPEIAKTKRLAKKQEAFRSAMLKQEPTEPKRNRWGSRPFQRKPR